MTNPSTQQTVDIRPPVTITLDIQQIECLQAHCFPYLLLSSETNIKSHEHNEDLNLAAIALDSAISDAIALIFFASKGKKKTRIQIKMLQCVAILFYTVLRKFPTAKDFPYLNNVINRLTDSIERQIWPD